MKENGRSKFVRLAEKRVNTAIKTIRLVGNLSNTNNYTYNDEDVITIFKTLERELRSAQQRFANEKRFKAHPFSLEKSKTLQKGAQS